MHGRIKRTRIRRRKLLPPRTGALRSRLGPAPFESRDLLAVSLFRASVS
jgi:hypothetical protein